MQYKMLTNKCDTKEPAYHTAAFRELYCRTSNPARPYMLWLSEVREARRLFWTFRARMAKLVQEVSMYSGILDSCRAHIHSAISQ